MAPAAGYRTRGLQIAAAGVVLLVGLALALAALLPRKAQLEYTNNVPILGIAAVIGPGDAICHTHVPVAAGADGVRLLMFANGPQPVPGRPAFGSPPLTVGVKGAGASTSGAIRAGYADQHFLTIPMKPMPRAVTNATVCIRNVGSAPVGIGGVGSSASGQVTVGGKPAPIEFLLDVVDRNRSTLSAVPDVMHRASIFAPSWVGPWTFYAFFALALVLFVAAVRLTLTRGDE